MANLKEMFDRAKSASDDLARLKNEIETLYDSGVEEDLAKAVELSDSLPAATKKADDLNKLYASMRDADSVASNAGALFVNSNPEEEDDENEDGKVKTLADFNALTPVERLAFINAGGRVQD